MFNIFEMILSVIIISAILIIFFSVKRLQNDSEALVLLSEIRDIEVAISEFRSKYSFYPGDLPFASDVFASNLNGDGDGFVKDDSESLVSWFELEKAGFVRLDFNFTKFSHAKIAANMYRSRKSDCGFQILADSKLNYVNFNFDRKANFLRLASDKGVGNLSKSCLSVDLVSFVDRKIDDANPLSGKVFADSGYENLYNKKADLECLCLKEKGKYEYCGNNEFSQKKCLMQYRL